MGIDVIIPKLIHFLFIKFFLPRDCLTTETFCSLKNTPTKQ